MTYLLSVSNAADVRTIVTHDLHELGIRFESKKDQEVAANFRRNCNGENALVSINNFVSKDKRICYLLAGAIFR